jgi:hypothetical protein
MSAVCMGLNVCIMLYDVGALATRIWHKTPFTCLEKINYTIYGLLFPLGVTPHYIKGCSQTVYGVIYSIIDHHWSVAQMYTNSIA